MFGRGTVLGKDPQSLSFRAPSRVCSTWARRLNQVQPLSVEQMRTQRCLVLRTIFDLDTNPAQATDHRDQTPETTKDALRCGH